MVRGELGNMPVACMIASVAVDATAVMRKPATIAATLRIDPGLHERTVLP
jgi:hypothetical protein